MIIWQRMPESKLLLIGKSARLGTGAGGTDSEAGHSGFQSIINPNWDFNQMGIGGLDKEFSVIFRRTFASRMFPPEIGRQLGKRFEVKLFCTFISDERSTRDRI
ncbi:unnamed protein product [Protopolystoma xenopodis]|uniref:Vesicle-fusing ATPase n=1 Tax=Protopolystoma xenopodis TaxID=117903 RepID=A0A3S5AT71_9PLAT|nr:unnamed protein product [Protopolystoma xenopodis]